MTKLFCTLAWDHIIRVMHMYSYVAITYPCDAGMLLCVCCRPIHDAVDNDRLEMAHMLLATAWPRIANYSGRTRQAGPLPNMKAFIHGQSARPCASDHTSICLL